jgi:lysozyme family protein
MNLKDRLLGELIAKEGGYVNHSSDRGRATNFGITLATAMAHGYIGDMKQFPISKAYEIYSRSYWDVNNLDDMALVSKKITGEIFDTSVNMGVTIAGAFLQRSLNVFNRRERDYKDLFVDGEIGLKTISALKDYLKINKYGEKNVLKALNGLQTARYIKLAERNETQEDFTNGWIRNRIN